MRKLMPDGLRQEIVGWREATIDTWRYLRAGARQEKWASKAHEIDRHEARLTLDYHRLEKGLTLPEPRRPFGLGVKESMEAQLASAPESDVDRPYIDYANDALASLDRWNEDGTVDGRIHPIAEDNLLELNFEDARTFFHSRRSIRNFDPEKPPTDAELAQVLELAQNSPSVCNRQGYRVHFYREREQIKQILAIQNGATGFADTVPCISVVTARRALFVGPDERNQRWVDGGLFAMTLVWAAHSLKLASCMLNWSLPAVSSDQLRKVADIPDGEDIVVLIALGHAAEGARRARSEKRATGDLGRIHS